MNPTKLAVISIASAAIKNYPLKPTLGATHVHYTHVLFVPENQSCRDHYATHVSNL